MNEVLSFCKSIVYVGYKFIVSILEDRRVVTSRFYKDK